MSYLVMKKPKYEWVLVRGGLAIYWKNPTGPLSTKIWGASPLVLVRAQYLCFWAMDPKPHSDRILSEIGSEIDLRLGPSWVFS
jgi:hypothetical protein